MKKILLTLAFVLSVLVGFAQNSFDRWVPVSGTDTYSTNITNFPGTYNNTQPYVKFGNGNTGNSTIAINGMVAVPIRIWDGDSWELVIAGDIPDQSNAILSYDNNNGYYKAIIFENIGSGSGGGVWGTITGTLSNQTDLQSALDAKQAADSDLTTIAGLTPSNDDFLQRKAGAWANRTLAQVKTDLNLAGSNTGDQTSIVGITGTLSEYNTSLTGADFATGGGTVTGASSGTNTGDQTSIVGITGTLSEFNTALTGADFATGGGTVSGTSTGTNTGDQTITLTGAVTGTGTGSFATALIVYAFPETYGAVGNGSTDDATAIQSCIDSGKPCYLLEKNYRVTVSPVIGDNETLIGSGKASIISIASNISAVTIAGKNPTVKNLQLLGNDTGAAQDGLHIEGNVGLTLDYTGGTFENIYAKDFGRAGFYIYRVVGTTGSLHQGAGDFKNCFAESSVNGFYVDDRAEYLNFTDCYAYANTTGLRILSGNCTWTGGNIVDGTTGVLFATGSNDGKWVIQGAKINHNATAISSTGVTLGSKFIGCQMIANGTITSGSGTGHSIISCTIGAAVMTITNNSRMEFIANTFNNTPTWTVTGTAPTMILNTFPSGTIPSNISAGLTMKNNLAIFGGTSDTETAQVTITASSDDASTTPLRIRNLSETTLATINGDGSWLTAYQGVTSLARTFVSHTPGSLAATSGSNSVIGQTIIGTLNTTSTYSGGSYTFLALAPTVTATRGLSVFGTTMTGGLIASDGTSNYTGYSATPTFNTTSTHTGGIAKGFRFADTETSITGLSIYPFVDESSSGLNGFGTATPHSRVQVSGSFATAYVAKTALYTLTSADYLVEVTSGTHTQTLPTAVGITGRTYVITNSGSGVVTVGTTSSQTFVNVTATPTTLTLAQFQTATVVSNGANWLKISGL